MKNLNKNEYYKVIFRDGNVYETIKLHKSKFKPILYVITFGLLLHKFFAGDKVVLYFSSYPSKSKIHLIYLQSNRDTSLKSVHSVYRYLLNYCFLNRIEQLETLVVNPFLSEKIMNRYGWKYHGRKKIIGKLYFKNCQNTSSNE